MRLVFPIPGGPSRRIDFGNCIARRTFIPFEAVVGDWKLKRSGCDACLPFETLKRPREKLSAPGLTIIGDKYSEVKSRHSCLERYSTHEAFSLATFKNS